MCPNIDDPAWEDWRNVVRDYARDQGLNPDNYDVLAVSYAGVSLNKCYM